MSDFEVCPVGTLQRLAQVEADLRSLRLCFEVTELERDKYKAERDALRVSSDARIFAETYTRLDAQAAKCIAERDALLEALRDMYAGWQYIRSFHGDLYGVGWDRCDEKASAAIAKAEGGSNG